MCVLSKEDLGSNPALSPVSCDPEPRASTEVSPNLLCKIAVVLQVECLLPKVLGPEVFRIFSDFGTFADPVEHR